MHTRILSGFVAKRLLKHNQSQVSEGGSTQVSLLSLLGLLEGSSGYCDLQVSSYLSSLTNKCDGGHN